MITGNSNIHDAVAVPTSEGLVFGILVEIRLTITASGELRSYVVDIYGRKSGAESRIVDEAIPVTAEPGSSWTEFGRMLNEHDALRWALEESARRKNPPAEPEQFPPATTDCNTQPQSAA